MQKSFKLMTLAVNSKCAQQRAWWFKEKVQPELKGYSGIY